MAAILVIVLPNYVKLVCVKHLFTHQFVGMIQAVENEPVRDSTLIIVGTQDLVLVLARIDPNDHQVPLIQFMGKSSEKASCFCPVKVAYARPHPKNTFRFGLDLVPFQPSKAVVIGTQETRALNILVNV